MYKIKKVNSMKKEKNNNMMNVFTFSFIQNTKSKVFIILTLVCGILMFFLTPTMIYMSEEIASTQASTIKNVYIIDDNNILQNTNAISSETSNESKTNKDSKTSNETKVNEKTKSSKDIVDKEDKKQSKKTKDKKKQTGTKIKEFGDIKFHLINKKFKSYKKEFEKLSNNKSALLVYATNKNHTYQLDVYKVNESDITEQDLAKFCGQLQSFYNDNKLTNMKLDKKSHKLVSGDITINVSVEGEDNNDKQSEIAIISVVMMVIMFFIVLSGENISTQIVTEKSTKLVEYLLVNIRPLELVCGKILASVCISIIQMLVMIGSGLLSILICKELKIINSYEDTLEVLKIGNIARNLGVLDIVLIILFLIIGFLFYAIVASMLSSTVSRLEDLSNVGMIFSLITLVSVYAIMAVTSFMEASKGVYIALVMIPFTSVFVAPQYIMLGKLSMRIYVIAVIIQMLCLYIFGKIAAKIYISLIMYTGKKINFKQIMVILKGGKVGELHE